MLNFLTGGAVNAVSTLGSKIVGIFTAKQERKKLAEIAKGKLALAKQTHTENVTMSHAEWEAVAVKATQDSWKDEYVTVIITAPFLLIILGAVYFVFTGDAKLLDAADIALSRLAALGIDMSHLMYVVVLAAVGLKAWRMGK